MKDKSQAHKWREGEGAFIRTQLILEPMPEIEEGGEVPTQVMALPWGANELKDAVIRERFDEPGTLEVNTRTATEVAENFADRSTDFFVNLDHSFHGKAYGWIEAVSVVEGEGIYLSVDWTAEGAALVMDRAYRYTSIEVILDASAWMMDGSPAVVVAVVGLALTNKPAVVEQAPVAFQTLTAALSASEGRKIGKRQNSPGDSGEKGVPTMSEGIFKGLFTGVFGREPKDDVDAAEMAAELKGYKEKYPELTADLTKATSQVAELTEKLDKATTTISEFETADKERREADQEGQIKAAVAAGKLAPTQADWAKGNFEAFLSLVESVKEGAVGPPKGRVVTDKAIDSADAPLGKPDSKALDIEVKAYMAANKIEKYHEAALAVKKLHAATGKEV